MALTGVEIPDHDNGSEANRDKDCPHTQSYAEEDALEAIELSLGSNHGNSVFSSLSGYRWSRRRAVRAITRKCDGL